VCIYIFVPHSVVYYAFNPHFERGGTCLTLLSAVCMSLTPTFYGSTYLTLIILSIPPINPPTGGVSAGAQDNLRR
jgi:hypothetical protein